MSNSGSVYYTVGVANNGNAPQSAKHVVERKARQIMDEKNWSSVRITQRHPEALIVIDDLVYYEYDLTSA
jgi:hypothetical protein